MDSALKLRVGEWVEVRSLQEILATLDHNRCLSGLPFMPEMVPYCGKRFRVFSSAHKTADTIELFAIRRLANTVHLAELRCNGSSHEGCQAGCLLFWKEAWLKRAPGPIQGPSGSQNAPQPALQDPQPATAPKALLDATKRLGVPDCYRCQATQMLVATTEVRRRDRWDPRFYIRDLTSGNVSLFDFVRFGTFAMLNAFLLRWFGFRLPRVRGRAGDKTPTLELNLQPGELVRVRSKQEIELTLNGNFRNRGMWFDVEMVPYCGKGPFRVLKRVDRIINEKTGEMMKLKNPCIILDGITCSGNYLYQRMFSRRHEYPYWREIWLERHAAAPLKPEARVTSSEPRLEAHALSSKD
jgi:hypothetical protein